jgi:hypothetical protein
MKEFLAQTSQDTPEDLWRTRANSWLDELLGPRPTPVDIKGIVTDGNEKGALRKASLLLLYARAEKDPIYPERGIGRESGMELHHIYPKDWCKNNAGGALQALLNPDSSGVDWVNAASNLIPMHRQTNNEWKKSSPVTFLDSKNVQFDANKDTWKRYFVSREAFNELMNGEAGVAEFWRIRSESIVEEIFSRTAV